MASISREFSGECFDFDRLCASCLGGLVLKREQKEVVSRLLEGKYVLAVLATRFEMSLIYHNFVLQADLNFVSNVHLKTRNRYHISLI